MMSDDKPTVSPARAVDPLVLAIDVGTSSARALVYDGQGRMVDGWEVHRPYAVQTTPDGGVVIDAQNLAELVAACIDDALAGVVGASREVHAVATDTYWHSLIGVNARGEAITPVYTWADTRSSGAAQELRQVLDEREVHSRTGAVLHSSYWPAKLLWISHTNPKIMDQVSHWMSFGEYVYLRFFGERRVSLSMASGTGIFDQNACTWDAELLSRLPIDTGKLSPLADFSDSMTGLVEPFSRRWPGLRTVPWFLPIGDGASNNVGSGGFGKDWVVAMIGTSGALRVVREAERVDIPSGLWTYRLDRRRFVQGGALSSGGNMFAWLEQTLRLDPVNQLEEELLAMTPDGHGLTWLPFLAGERSPHWDSNARAALVGMRLDTKPIDIARAALEAIAYRFAAVYRILKQVIPAPKGIIGSGAGLIHSPAWLQIVTDVLGEPVVVSAVPEASSRGTALLALECMGAIPGLGTAPAPLGAKYEPNPESTTAYRAAMRRQERLYDLLIEHGEGLND